MSVSIHTFTRCEWWLLSAGTTSRSACHLAGLHDAWVKANAAERRAMLGTLFDGLRVDNDQIVAWIPRKDRTAEVIAIMEQAFGETVPAGGKGGVLLRVRLKLDAAVG